MIYNRLIENMETLHIAKEEAVLSREIFKRLEQVPLVDEYKAYQLLSDEWTNITIDLEMIQTEGFKATKQVDPNLVIKKRSGKDIEVQEGWLGRIIPFELVEKVLLQEETIALEEKEERLAQILGEQQEIMDSLTEEDKEELSEVINNDNTAFLAGPLNKLVKDLLKNNTIDDYEEESLDRKVLTMKNFLEEEKELKRDIKTESANLHKVTKKTIEDLTDYQIYSLLQEKWISPIIDGLKQLPLDVLDVLAAKVQALADKYETTLADVEKEIRETETALAAMIDELIGSESDLQGLAELKALLGGE